ncbi:MAG: ASCH domain-containing protein [Thermosipho sp. (in: Bacteria)]|nr:ASCH domain-containing protein [Thermosipho sp. (in: thermotogales)]
MDESDGGSIIKLVISDIPHRHSGKIDLIFEGDEMILFKPEHKELILQGIKTQTRRTGKKRWKVGSIHQAKLNFKKGSKPFALLKIISVRQERLGDISEDDAKAEGYSSIQEYKEAFKRIYGFWEPDLMVWVVDFEVVQR